MGGDRRIVREWAGSRVQAPEDLRQLLLSAWQADTSFAPDQWSAANPALGQCAVTALIVQDLFGGELMRGCLDEGSHYWNRLPNGQEVDLSSGQFGVDPIISGVEPRSRDYVLSYPATGARYCRLLSHLRCPAEGQ
jgi:hypothetical protein